MNKKNIFFLLSARKLWPVFLVSKLSRNQFWYLLEVSVLVSAQPLQSRTPGPAQTHISRSDWAPTRGRLVFLYKQTFTQKCIMISEMQKIIDITRGSFVSYQFLSNQKLQFWFKDKITSKWSGRVGSWPTRGRFISN